MAAVFLMQPLGQLTAAWVGWAVLVGLVHQRNLNSLPANVIAPSDEERILILSTIDSIWRWVIGVGAIPALIAIIYRISIPESPRYTMDVDRDGKRALLDIRRHRARAADQPADLAAAQAAAIEEIVRQGAHPGGAAIEKPNYFTWPKVKEFLFTEGNWRYLIATSMCWFLLDFAFYGLAINNPRQLAAIWAATSPSNSARLYDWRNATRPSYCQPTDLQNVTLSSNSSQPYDWQNPFNPGSDMYWELFDNAKQYIITISSGSMVGSIVLIFAINRIRRKTWLIISFWILAGFLAITAATLRTVEFWPSHPTTIALYIVCQFFFNFGAFLES